MRLRCVEHVLVTEERNSRRSGRQRCDGHKRLFISRLHRHIGHVHCERARVRGPYADPDSGGIRTNRERTRRRRPKRQHGRYHRKCCARSLSEADRLRVTCFLEYECRLSERNDGRTVGITSAEYLNGRGSVGSESMNVKCLRHSLPGGQRHGDVTLKSGIRRRAQADKLGILRRDE
jgi:hypothetical protein